MGRFLTIVIGLLVALVALGVWVTRAQPFDADELPTLTGDAQAGRRIFLAAGCASCHADRGAEVQDAPILSGGRRIATQFGTFVTPNISSDPVHGIGDQDLAALASVLLRGVSPDGRHLYPAMPYTSFNKMKLQDIADLKAYLDGLPASDTPRAANELAFPYSLRRGVGLWKRANLKRTFVGAAPSPQMERGRYLVEALGHCAECHTPRTGSGGLDTSRWMAGSVAEDGRESAPNITPAALDWDNDQIAWYLESGFTPGHDTASREMESVIANLSQLPDEDLRAIATYLAGLAPIK